MPWQRIEQTFVYLNIYAFEIHIYNTLRELTHWYLLRWLCRDKVNFYKHEFANDKITGPFFHIACKNRNITCIITPAAVLFDKNILLLKKDTLWMNIINIVYCRRRYIYAINKISRNSSALLTSLCYHLYGERLTPRDGTSWVSLFNITLD